MQKTCIVIPCYNEADRLEEENFLSYAAGHADINFLFVNDGSSDATIALLEKMKDANSEQIMYIDLRKNLGKAEAVRQGIVQSFQWKDFDFVGYMDADLATPLEESEWLLKHLRDDPAIICAFGSRKKTHDNLIERNQLRHNFGRLYAGFITGLLSLDIYDTQCGAKFFRTETAKKIFSSPFIDRWLFDVEIFCRIKKLASKKDKQPIKEVVLRKWLEKGHSRIRKIDIIRLPLKTIRIFLKYL